MKRSATSAPARVFVLLLAIAGLVGSGCRGPQSQPEQQSAESRPVAPPLASRDACPYRRSFAALQDGVRRVKPAAALSALYAYAADPANETPEACQSLALDAAIGSREAELVALRLADGRSIPAQASYRCTAVDPGTTACDGAVEDVTAHPFSIGVQPLAIARPTAATLVSGLPDAQARGVYRIRVADLLDGRGAGRLPPGAPVALATGKELMALVAIYSAPPPWRYRKLVWYYQ